MTGDYTENSLVEQPAIALFSELGWEAANCFYEASGPKGGLGRETPYNVVLEPRLRAVLKRLNPRNRFTPLFPKIPYVTEEAIRAVLWATDHPKAAQADPKDFFDNRFLRELEDSGFVKELYNVR
ncbi:MAG: hypothetical protein HYY46_15045 [Deltaproteobacteria bacterium]|nr:hypothetical protein [Deltaproteobacteria bacterium]